MRKLHTSVVEAAFQAGYPLYRIPGIVATETGALRIDCDVVSKFGQNIFELAKNVQENVKSSVESVTGLRVAEVNVTVCGIALPKDSKK